MLIRRRYLAFLFAWNLLGCVSHEIKPLTVAPTAAYSIRSSDGGLEIAVDPFITRHKVQSVLTIDVTERGFAPMLLVMENRTTQDLVLIKDHIKLVDAAGRTHHPVSADVMVSRFEHEKIVYPLAGIGILPYAWAENANAAMLRDWSGKELAPEELLMPGRKAYGFVYFYLGHALQWLHDATLHVPVVNVRTGERKTSSLRIWR